MILVTVFAVVWLALIWLFSEWFSTGIASSLLAVIFGTLSIYCTFFGQQFKVFALKLDASAFERFPTILSRVRFPAPDLAILMMLLYILMSILSQASVGWLEEQVAAGSVVFPKGAEHHLHILLRVSMAVGMGTLIPTLLLYGVILSMSNRQESFLELFFAAAFGIFIAVISVASVRGNWWLLNFPIYIIPFVMLLSFSLSAAAAVILISTGRRIGRAIRRGHK
jgi:hypothetical protein